MDFTKLKPGASLLVKTANSIYEIENIDGHYAYVKGGQYLPEKTKVRFTGCTFGGSAIKVGHLEEGLFMELWLDKQCITTSQIVEIIEG